MCDVLPLRRYIKLLHELATSEKANVDLRVREMTGAVFCNVLQRWHLTCSFSPPQAQVVELEKVCWEGRNFAIPSWCASM